MSTVTPTTTTPPKTARTPEALAAAWATLKAEDPGLRIRAAAEKLDCSEAELLATQVLEGTVTRLAVEDWPTLVEDFRTLGRVMSLTRNAGCVLEHKGPFEEVDIVRAPHGAMATVIGPIEQRVFFKHWGHAFAATLPGQQGRLLQSIQVFDTAGDAIVKVFLQADGNQAGYDALVQKYRAEAQTAAVAVAPIAPTETAALEDIDKEAFLEAWANINDPHDYFGMLRKHKAHREDAMKLALGRFTRRVDPSALQTMLEHVSSVSPRLPIMIFAGNKGNIQIHQDEVRHIKAMGPWLNVLDPDFNMHLHMDHVANVYEVVKPADGDHVTSLECYDHDGELTVQFFGLRKPGIPERQDWRELVKSLPSASE